MFRMRSVTLVSANPNREAAAEIHGGQRGKSSRTVSVARSRVIGWCVLQAVSNLRV